MIGVGGANYYARSGATLIAFFGPRGTHGAEAARAAGFAEPFHTEDIEALIAWTKKSLGSKDLVLVKGSRGMKLERLVEVLK